MNENNMTYTCPNCGGTLVFDIKSQKVVCQECHTEFSQEDLKKYQDELDATKQEEVKWEDKTTEFSNDELSKLKVYYCSSCGGNLITDENTSSTICPYCGSPVILKERLAGGLKPNYVLPFKHDKDEIIDVYTKYVKKKLFVKGDFLKNNSLDKFQGIYVPYWLFTSDTEGRASFKGYTTRTWEDFDYVYTEKSYYSIYREGGVAFDHLPHDASSKIDDKLIESVEPYTFANAKPFSTNYLTGHAADKYDVESKDCEDHVLERMRNTLTKMLQSTVVGYSGVSCTGSSISMIDPVVEYALYPLWYFSSTYKDKKYIFAMNGDSGKMTGNLPLSMGKFFMWFAIWLLGLGGLIFLIAFLCCQNQFNWIQLAVGGGIGLIVAIIFCVVNTISLKPVKKAKDAKNYTVKESFHLDVKESHFLYSTISKVAKPKNNKS